MNNATSSSSSSPQEWLSILKLTERTQTNVNSEDRLSIVKDGHVYYTLNESEIRGNIKKLSLNEIKKISRDQLQNLEESFSSNPTEIGDMEGLKKNIQIYTKKLTKQKNKPHKKITNAFNKIINFLLGPRRSQSSREGGKIEDTIHHQIQRLPQLLQELKSEVSDQDRLDLIQDRMIKDFPKEELQGKSVPQFANDLQRGIAFLRKDSYLQIDDHHPQPSYQLNGETRVKAGVQALQDLFQTEQDERWETALQLVANQTSLNNIFDAAIVKFNLDTGDVSWPDPTSEDKNFKLIAKFSQNLPPVHLEFIRNAETHAIEKVKVEVTGSLDIRREWQEQKGGEKIILANAVTGKLNYTVTLDRQNHPIISDLHSSLESAT